MVLLRVLCGLLWFFTLRFSACFRAPKAGFGFGYGHAVVKKARLIAFATLYALRSLLPRNNFIRVVGIGLIAPAFRDNRLDVAAGGWIGNEGVPLDARIRHVSLK